MAWPAGGVLPFIQPLILKPSGVANMVLISSGSTTPPPPPAPKESWTTS